MFVCLLLSACNVNRSTEVNDAITPQAGHVGSFIWHDLVTDDIGAAKRFYSELFGWQFVSATSSNGRDYTLIKNQGQYFAGMVQLDDPADGEDYSRWLGYLSVSDVNTALSNTESKNGSIVIPGQTIEDIGRAAAIQDPQGAVVGLITSDLEKPEARNPPLHGDLVWNELLTSDPKNAAAFYQRLSGVSVEVIERRGGEYRLLESAGRKRAGIVQNPFVVSPSAWLSYFSVDDPVEMADKAKKLGGTILIAPVADVREGTLALISDPTGAILVLEQAGTASQSGEIQ